MKLIKIGDQWFTGFRLMSNEKMRVTTNAHFPMLLTDSQVPQAVEDLKSLGVTDYRVHGTYEVIQ